MMSAKCQAGKVKMGHHYVTEGPLQIGMTLRVNSLLRVPDARSVLLRQMPCCRMFVFPFFISLSQSLSDIKKDENALKLRKAIILIAG
ncbi:hypothetical protein ABW286_14890 [Erwinia papayae]|uniref:Uncharacterized protein n=1 Tax=Erwinia papayae TaxID=206499 RepID=A0ABV3N3P0_9GAMM